MDSEALRTLNENVRAAKTRLYHGGIPGLAVGDMLLPPAESGVRSMKGDSERAGFRRITTSDRLVYVTTERSLAAAAAAYWSRREGDVPLCGGVSRHRAGQLF
ncbi:hypothetical protein N1031_10660 [Herbiconiux moechotypicola]|uniref:Uncharacterized protein n=1 Tax=Herbiconiux moechotypicola TaxID=637393 RepID=A0ABN3DML9_9MICO|nr:hypothetical protein [Herbiconiux moechotypicola]MCS5730221.1 hypothetical protein [Herbiconiux moechotypicola]